MASVDIELSFQSKTKTQLETLMSDNMCTDSVASKQPSKDSKSNKSTQKKIYCHSCWQTPDCASSHLALDGHMPA